MTRPEIFAKLRRIPNEPGSQWIEVYIPRQLQKIRIVLANNGFIAILKEITVTSMSSVEVYDIAGK
jgi:hypothetical protein